MQYTITKINTALEKLEIIKRKKKNLDKLYVQYEKSLLQTKLALKPVFNKFDLKQELNEMKLSIKEEFDKAGKEYSIFSIRNTAVKKMREKYNFVSMPDRFYIKWDEFVNQIIKTHDEVRKKLIKDGSIKT